MAFRIIFSSLRFQNLEQLIQNQFGLFMETSHFWILRVRFYFRATFIYLIFMKVTLSLMKFIEKLIICHLFPRFGEYGAQLLVCYIMKPSYGPEEET